jgi:hypothetical protein
MLFESIHEPYLGCFGYTFLLITNLVRMSRPPMQDSKMSHIVLILCV